MKYITFPDPVSNLKHDFRAEEQAAPGEEEEEELEARDSRNTAPSGPAEIGRWLHHKMQSKKCSEKRTQQPGDDDNGCQEEGHTPLY